MLNFFKSESFSPNTLWNSTFLGSPSFIPLALQSYRILNLKLIKQAFSSSLCCNKFLENSTNICFLPYVSRSFCISHFLWVLAGFHVVNSMASILFLAFRIIMVFWLFFHKLSISISLPRIVVQSRAAGFNTHCINIVWYMGVDKRFFRHSPNW
jgi:hypothetical protein